MVLLIFRSIVAFFQQNQFLVRSVDYLKYPSSWEPEHNVSDGLKASIAELSRKRKGRARKTRHAEIVQNIFTASGREKCALHFAQIARITAWTIQLITSTANLNEFLALLFARKAAQVLSVGMKSEMIPRSLVPGLSLAET